MSEQTLRSEMLLGSDALARLRRSRVAVSYTHLTLPTILLV